MIPRAVTVAQAIDYLPSKHKALSSNPSSTGEKKKIPILLKPNYIKPMKITGHPCGWQDRHVYKSTK
jgi:hypothetical protein